MISRLNEGINRFLYTVVYVMYYLALGVVLRLGELYFRLRGPEAVAPYNDHSSCGGNCG